MGDNAIRGHGLKIALVMTLLNEANNNLQQLLASILKQTLQPDEVVFCDGGSTDSTLAILHEWKERNDLPFSLKVFSRPGANISEGRNAAIMQTDADIIAVTDGSCRLDARWLEEITKPLYGKDKSVGISFGDTKAEGRSRTGRLFAQLHSLRTHSANNESTDFSSRSVAFTRDTWLGAGGYPEWLTLAGEDTLFFLNARKITKDFVAQKSFVHWTHGAETLAAIFKMHKRNSVGGGEALMYPIDHLKMVGVYMAALAGICCIAIYPIVAVLAIAGLVGLWSRFSLSMYGRTHRLFDSFLLLPSIVATRDIAMITGYIIGCKRRFAKYAEQKSFYPFYILLDFVFLALAVSGDLIHNHFIQDVNIPIEAVAIFMLPGFLLAGLLKLKNSTKSESFIYSVGLSIFLLLASGLAINTVLPLAGITDPLSWKYMVPTIGLTNLIFLYFCHRKRIDLTVNVTAAHDSLLQKIMVLAPVAFVIFGILGAFSLNNSGSDIFTITVLTAIGLYIALLLSLKERLNSSVYPLALYMICLSLLFMVSLRGWMISGHDILAEYKVFEITKSHLRWNIGYLNDAYNACLSITLLPTIISGLLPTIPDQYILRVVFQMIFALSPIAMFHFASRFLNRYLAFVATIVFMVQSPFLRDFPFLTRQEIATFFFVMMLLSFSRIKSSNIGTTAVALFFGWSMIVSHYSTTYIALLMLVISWLLLGGIKNIRQAIPKKINALLGRVENLWASTINEAVVTGDFDAIAQDDTNYNKSWLPSWKVILVLVCITFAWNIWITHTSSNLSSFTKSAVTTTFDGSQLSGIEEQINGPTDEQTNSKLITTYASKSGIGGDNTNNGRHYSKQTYESYDPIIDIPFELFPRVNVNLAQKIFSFGSVLQDSIKALLVFGVFIVAFRVRKITSIDRDMSKLAIASLIILFIALLIPAFTQYYDVFRTYQQLLVVLAIPTVLATSIVLGAVSKKYRYSLLILLYVAYYFFVSPVVPQLVGSGYAQLQLNNYGLYYNLYYTHESEYSSILWLQEHDDQTEPIYADWFATKKFDAFTTKPLWIIDNVLPANITADSYVYADYTNTQLGAAYTDYDSVELNYTFPSSFLNANKNAIYSNGATEIYK